jgi:hypothetical protein
MDYIFLLKVLSNSRSGRFNSGKDIPVFTEYENGLAPEPIWMLYKTEKSLAPVKNGTLIPRTSRP